MGKIVKTKTKKRMLILRASDGEIEATGVEITTIKTIWYDRCRPYKSQHAPSLRQAVTTID
jgi:hypothetical protein